MGLHNFLFRATSLMFVAALAVSACTSPTQPGASTAPSAAAGPVAGGTVMIPIGGPHA